MNDEEKPIVYAFGIKQHIFTIYNMKTPRTDEEKIFDIRNLVKGTEITKTSEIMRLIKMVVDCPSADIKK